MAVTISPVANGQLFDNQGHPLVSGKVFTYVGGSFSILKTAYRDADGTIPWANPIDLTSAGRVPGSLWLTRGDTYNIVVTAADGTTVLQQWENIKGVDAVAGATELVQLTDVDANAPNNGDVLVYDSTSQEWVAQTPSGGGGPRPLVLSLQSGEAKLDGVAFESWAATTRQTTTFGAWNETTESVQLSETGLYQVTLFSDMYGYYGSFPSFSTTIRYGAEVDSPNTIWPDRSNNQVFIPDIWSNPSSINWTDTYCVRVTNTATDDIKIKLYAESYGNEFSYVGYTVLAIITKIGDL